MAIIPCEHTHNVNPMPQSSPRGWIIVRSLHQILDRLIYHNPEGQEVRTPYRHRVLPTKSHPFNPFCPNCKTNFLNYLINCLGYTYDHGVQKLHDLQQRVCQKLTDNDGLDHHDHHDVEVVVCDLTTVKEWHTWDLQAYMAWSRVGKVLALSMAIRALERVEFEEMLREGSKWKEENCAICLEGLGPAATKGEQPVVLKLPCQHAFHRSCMVEWLTRNHVCPLCRFQLPLQEH